MNEFITYFAAVSLLALIFKLSFVLIQFMTLLFIISFLYIVFLILAPQMIQKIAFDQAKSNFFLPLCIQWKLFKRCLAFLGCWVFVIFLIKFSWLSESLFLLIPIFFIVFLLTSYLLLKIGFSIVNVFDNQAQKMQMSIMNIIKASFVYHLIGVLMFSLTALFIAVPIIILSKFGYLNPDPNIAYDLGPIVYYLPLIFLFAFIAIGYYFGLITAFFSVFYKTYLLSNRFTLQARI